ncbi:hypothetical protein LCM4577_21685 [Mesorhizobium sp. LCM 4577]|nr:hypothetical protein LCM4577_21685 [Mesorhizobium sp. LCM 4577]
MKAAIATKAISRKRPADSRPAGSAPVLIEMISATAHPRSETIDRFNAVLRSSQKKSGLGATALTSMACA